MNEKRVIENIGNGEKKALFVYLIKPFLVSKGKEENDTRFRPARTIVDILNNYGYTVDVVNNDYSGLNLDLDRYDLIFGQGDLFNKVASDIGVKKIYYATGRYKNHIKEELQKRQDYLYKRKGKRLPLMRKGLGFNEGAKHADGVLALGNGCAKTYYNVCDNVESVLFEPSDYISHDLDCKSFGDNRRNFLFFSGPGPLLKGLDLALDTFAELPNYNLYISGLDLSIPNTGNNQKFIQLYRKELTMDNVFNLKWMDKRSDLFNSITNKCNFILSFSLSESTNMSTLACMRRGMIPVSTEYSLDIDIDDELKIDVPSDISVLSNRLPQISHWKEEVYKDKSYEIANWANDRLSWDKAKDELNDKIGKLLI